MGSQSTKPVPWISQSQTQHSAVVTHNPDGSKTISLSAPSRVAPYYCCSSNGKTCSGQCNSFPGGTTPICPPNVGYIPCSGSQLSATRRLCCTANGQTCNGGCSYFGGGTDPICPPGNTYMSC